MLATSHERSEMTMRLKPCLMLCTLIWSAACALSAQAQTTTVTHYPLGESDPGAAAGNVGANPTLPAIGSPALARFGTPSYVATSPGSALAMQFDGVDDRYEGAAAANPATDNFGVELLVRSNGSTTANATIAYQGHTGLNGYGIFRIGGEYAALFGGIVIFGGGPAAAVSSEWTHLALVRDNGVATFYVNGLASGTTTVASPAPPIAATLIGGNPLQATEHFDGAIDEVRFFTFAPGTFDPAVDLNVPTLVSSGPTLPVPVGHPLALGLLAALLVASTLVVLTRQIAPRG